MQEFEECTFKPQTRAAPGYIKRIAKSEKQVCLVCTRVHWSIGRSYVLHSS